MLFAEMEAMLLKLKVPTFIVENPIKADKGRSPPLVTPGEFTIL